LSDYIDENFDDDETDELWGGYTKMQCPQLKTNMNDIGVIDKKC
jgi:hypothetical protein